MPTGSNRKYWVAWSAASLVLVGVIGYMIFAANDKTFIMPGKLSPGHHQLAESCDSCHTDGFGGSEALQEACLSCHGDDRKKPFDSHPRAKFTDPRNADRLEKINALQCVTCHVEHKPEITLKDGLTQPRDICFNCHAEIAEDRPSHEGMDFTSCKNSGCHNFHNNRALYTDYLVKHMDAPDIAPRPAVPEKEFSTILDEIVEYPRDHYPIKALSELDIDVPGDVEVSNKTRNDWLGTAHAEKGVNCSACHQPRNKDGKITQWQNHPGLDGCQSCHQHEVARFTSGKHGMRLAAGLSPMTPGQAILPMKKKASHSELTCTSCHAAHQFDVVEAAVESCLGCHVDEHSLAYKNSRHYELFLAENSDGARPGSGVSCATCHMPRIDYDINDWSSRKLVDHNQSHNLSPNSKMIRSACQHCHGLGFSIDALADQQLIKNNFRGRPSVHVQSIDLAREDNERHLREKDKEQ